MDLKTKRSIVPQVFVNGGRTGQSVLSAVLTVALAFTLSGCVSVRIEASKPLEPQTVAQAEEYLNQRDQMLYRLEVELNEKERDCYDKFLVSDCVDAVRARRAEYRRAHILAATTANDLIRLDKFQRRQKKD